MFGVGLSFSTSGGVVARLVELDLDAGVSFPSMIARYASGS